MKISSSIDLILQLAAREAIAAEYREIEPEHILEAVLKAAELPAAIRDQGGAGAFEEAARDLDAVRDDLKHRAIDVPRARRELRSELGNGGNPYSGGTMHRSKASRELFEAAAVSAARDGCGTLTAHHLLNVILASPTPRMERALGDSGGVRLPTPLDTPFLDAVGRDLTHLAAEGKLAAVSGRQAEARALLAALSLGARHTVVFVTEDEHAARTVIEAAAQAIAGNRAPSNMRGRRIIDVSAARALSGAVTPAAELLAEAAAHEVILYLGTIEPGADPADFERRVGLLKPRLKDGTARFLCRIAPHAYAQSAQRGTPWKQFAEVLYVHALRAKELPHEL
jgi:ATP-dependent Clp protease ATP-binding subunit ClpC